MPLAVTVWNENVHEQRDESVQLVYPEGIHEVVADAIAAGLGDRVLVRTATLDQPDQGLPGAVLESTDVLVWWSHIANDRLDDALAARVIRRVEQGMGLVILHSGLFSKVSLAIMGTSGAISRWAPDTRSLVWTVRPDHAIAAGVDAPIVVAADEMYSEPCDIPDPDELVFISSFATGEVFRSGCCYHRGEGRVFYFSPGDQQYPVYRNQGIRRVIANSVAWAGAPERAPQRDEAVA